MTISFRINADSEAVFTKKSRQDLLDASDVVALDWLKDIIFEAQVLYGEIHPKVFPRASEYKHPEAENDAR